MSDRPASRTPFTGALTCGMLLLALVSVSAWAEGAEKTTQKLSGTGSALTQLARAVNTVAVSEPSLVVMGNASGALGQSPGKAELSLLRERMLATVASAIELAAQREVTPLSPEEARRKARELRLPLVYLAPSLTGGSVRLEMTVDKWPRGLWQRAVHPRGVRTASAVFEVTADSSIRSLFPRPALSSLKATRLPLPLSEPLALACGDLGETGARSLATVNRQEIILASLKEGRVTTQTRRTWASLAEISGTPLRDPLAGAHFENDSLVIGLSDRAALVRLSQSLSQASYGRRVYPLGQGKCADFSATGILPSSLPCPTFEMKSHITQIPPQVESEKSRDAYAEHSLVLPSGVVQTVSVELAHRTTRAVISISSASDQTRRLFIEDTGNAILLADLDGDGAIEVISASARDGSLDSLRIHTLKGGTISLVQSFSLGAVHALSICPFSGENPLTLIAAAGDALWTIH